MANSNAVSFVPGLTATATSWSFWADTIQVVNASNEAVSVTTDGSVAVSLAAGTETVPAGAMVVIPNRQLKQPAVSITAPGTTTQGTFNKFTQVMATTGYNVWTSAGAAAANPTTISVIGAAAGTGDVTVEPR